MAYKYHLPQVYSMLDDLPKNDCPENEALFWKAVAGELSMLVEYASKAEIPELVMWDRMKNGEQYIWEFYVNDLSKPRTNSINWHAQNIRQWLYAGAIVLQNGKVTTHH